tara:strand:+ start:12723 stop:13637 length:915 start_codon:yes stop_codon:yes gene_type:complete
MDWVSGRRRFLKIAVGTTTVMGLAPLAFGQDGDWSATEDAVRKAQARLSEIEAEIGGRIGVSAVNLDTGFTLTHRGDERFAMCSSFKWLLAALVLKQVDAGNLFLEQTVYFTRDDMVPHAPVTESVLGLGYLTVAELCEATVQTSDNPAANLLLRLIGGPEGFTEMLRADGADTTRLDRWEPELNANTPGDPRDTTTPNAMVSLMGYYLFGAGLSGRSADLVKEWMTGATTGLDRLRAGFPDYWISGDKTGTSSNDQTNDVAFAFQPSTPHQPVLISSYLNVSDPMTRDPVHAEIGQLVMKALA